MRHFRMAKDDASKAAAAARKFLIRIEDPQTRASATDRCQELERAIDEL